MAKIIKSFRINEDFSNEVKAIADEHNVTYSQLVELSLYSFLEKKSPPSKRLLLAKEHETKQVHFTLELDSNHFKRLSEVTNKKNSTLSQEIRYRLSATLDNPVFSDNEFSSLMKARGDLNRVGNLLKLAIAKEKVIDNELLNNIDKQIKELKKEWYDTLVKMRKRQL